MGDENQGKLVNGIQVGLYFFFISLGNRSFRDVEK